ncbi:unnamed protein product [Mytilus coruscus]|uniref:Reverse transcriptase domain-containing protein n=1 Tax=Mytilus coruscus TaxID=42192 RepID=A0A6J8DYA2_MYTCO|nr:unnamed protein product [Mytilus coruscus]
MSLENQVDKVEAGSRKNNLLFMGVDDKPSNRNRSNDVYNVFDESYHRSSAQKETWVECEMKIRLFLDSVFELGKVFAENVQIERVQRVRGTEITGPVENGDEYCNEKQIRFKWNSNKAQLCKDLLDSPTSLAFLNDTLDLMDNNKNDADKCINFSLAKYLFRSRSNISSEELNTYFSNLLNPDVSDKDVNFSEFVDTFVQSHNTDYGLCIEENFSYLDSDITCEEILSEIKKLKSPGEDGLPWELYKCLSSTLMPVLLKVSNKIFHTVDFPERWSTAIIITLFKKVIEMNVVTTVVNQFYVL